MIWNQLLKLHSLRKNIEIFRNSISLCTYLKINELEKWLSCLLYHFLKKIIKAEVSDIESLFHAFENHIVRILDFRIKRNE